MKIVVTITLCLLSNLIHAQGKVYDTSISAKGNRSYWQKYQKNFAKEMNVPGIDTSSAHFFFRFWGARQFIDIWENSNGVISGKVTSWAKEYNRANRPANYFIESISLDHDTASLIKKFIISSGILNLPTDDSIKGWQMGFDGVEYIFEYSTEISYSFKSYWTPSAQDSLKEAIKIQSFIENILAYSNSQSIWTKFREKIPYPCFINSGPMATCRVSITKPKKHRK